ncbi:hypothetical protein EDC90_103220 [Martelella mediterranea]|uniref:Uncharacterized protein n=2 Tax=Martelella mediterranea TaxID=293089 RepID=A0A4R3NKX8_9HYPH|nr:hypothetical protein EDC90_103220 [Martelella mediterranea]
MTQSHLPAKERLERIRSLVVSAAPVKEISSDTAGLHRETDGMDPAEPEVMASVPHTCPTANRELLLKHADIPAQLIRMVDALKQLTERQNADLNALRLKLEEKGGRPAKDYAAECAMKCSEPAFKAFMEARHGIARPLTDERVTDAVRKALMIASRADLNQDRQAAARWRAMVKDFEHWRRRG